MAKLDFIPIVQQVPNTTHAFYDVNSIQEISVSLFGQCNMKCDFCITHQRKSKFSIKTLKTIQHNITNTIMTNPKQRFQICLYGGELFHDGITDNAFKHYKSLIANIEKVGQRCGKQIQFNITTNCIHSKRDRVVDLLKSCNINTLHCSFDFQGRFHTSTQLQTFVDNVYFYKQHFNVVIGFILSTENMNVLINDRDSEIVNTFNKLYNDFDVVFDYCYPTDTIKPPTESQLGDYVIWLYNHYGNIKSLSDITSGKLTCSCPSVFIIEDNDPITNCCDFDDTIERYIMLKRCNKCYYRLRCLHPCVRLFSNDQECHIKRLFDYIKNNSMYLW